MASYTFTDGVDYTIPIVPSQLRQDIENDGGIEPNIVSIYRTNTQLTIDFDVSLSSAEEGLLAHIISYYAIRVEDNIRQIENISLAAELNTTTYKLLAQIYFNSSKFSKVSGITAVSFMDSGATSYQIKVAITGQTIAEETFTNTTDAINDLTIIDGEINTNTTIDIEAKKTGGQDDDYIYVHTISLAFR